jgi:hypothetical protein
MMGVAHGYTVSGKTYATDGSQRDVASAIGAARSGSRACMHMARIPRYTESGTTRYTTIRLRIRTQGI